MQDPLNRVIIMQKVAAFASTSLSSLVDLAYVNQSWNDTIKNYSFHLFEERAITDDACFLEETLRRAFNGVSMPWLLEALVCSKSFLARVPTSLIIVCTYSSSLTTMDFVLDKIFEVGGAELLRNQLTALDKYGSNCILATCRNSTMSLEKSKRICAKIVQVGGLELLKDQLCRLDYRGCNCLACVCSNYGNSTKKLKEESSSSSSGSTTQQAIMMTHIMDKLVEVGGDELLKSFLVATSRDGTNNLMYLCSNPALSLETMKLFFTKVEASAGIELLRDLLTARNNDGYDCLKNFSSNSSVQEGHQQLELLLYKILELCGADELKTQLTLVDYFGINTFKSFCRHFSLSVEVMNILFHKLFQVGGAELVKVQITGNDMYGMSCLMGVCSNQSVSVEVLNYFLEKVLEIDGGSEILNKQLAAKNDEGQSCATFVCSANPNATSLLNIIFAKSADVGGPELVETQLRQCLNFACTRAASSTQLLRLLFDKMMEIGGIDMLKSFLTSTNNATDGDFSRTCLMLVCEKDSWAPTDVMKMIFDKIIEVGGSDLLRSQLVATDTEDGCNCLLLACKKYNISEEQMQLILDKIVEVGSEEFLKSLLSATDFEGHNCLNFIATNACEYSPLKQNVVKLIAATLYHFNLFEQQYSTLSDDEKSAIEQFHNIDSSWVPE